MFLRDKATGAIFQPAGEAKAICSELMPGTSLPRSPSAGRHRIVNDGQLVDIFVNPETSELLVRFDTDPDDRYETLDVLPA